MVSTTEILGFKIPFYPRQYQDTVYVCTYWVLHLDLTIILVLIQSAVPEPAWEADVKRLRFRTEKTS